VSHGLADVDAGFASVARVASRPLRFVARLVAAAGVPLPLDGAAERGEEVDVVDEGAPGR